MSISRTLAFIFIALMSLLAAAAQTSVYASVELTQYGYSSPVEGNFTYAPGTGHYSNYSDGGGVSGGVVYLFPSASRLKAGIDLRGMYSPGSHGGAGSFGSLRIAFVPRQNPLLPYFQIGGGLLTTTYTSAASNPLSGRGRVTSGAADFDFGLEVRANSRFTIKAIEMGGFAGSNVSHASLGMGVSCGLRSSAAQKP